MPLADLSYDASLRALASQEASVDELRQRAGMVLAAATVSASLFGSQTITRIAKHQSHTVLLGVAALLALGVAVGAAVYVLMPKGDFEFSVDGTVMYEQLYEIRDDGSEIKRRLTYWMLEMWKANEEKKEVLARWFVISAGALVFQLVLSILAPTTTI